MKKPRFIKTVRRFLKAFKNNDINLYEIHTYDYKGSGVGFTIAEARKMAWESRKTFMMW